MDAKKVNKIIKKADALVELVDVQIETLNGIVDSIREYQEFLQDELERLKQL